MCLEIDAEEHSEGRERKVAGVETLSVLYSEVCFFRVYIFSRYDVEAYQRIEHALGKKLEELKVGASGSERDCISAKCIIHSFKSPLFARCFRL